MTGLFRYFHNGILMIAGMRFDQSAVKYARHCLTRISSARCQHHAFGDPRPPQYERGIWHVYDLEQGHHASILPLWLGTQRQKQFWTDIGDWMSFIDASL